MPVQITITGENAKEALQEIDGLAAALVGASAPVTDKPVKQTRAKSPEPKQEEPAKTDVDQGQNKETQQDETEVDGNAPSIVELREKAAAVAKADKANSPKIKAMLSKYGYDAVSKVEEKDRAAIMEELEAI